MLGHPMVIFPGPTWMHAHYFTINIMDGACVTKMAQLARLTWRFIARCKRRFLESVELFLKKSDMCSNKHSFMQILRCSNCVNEVEIGLDMSKGAKLPTTDEINSIGHHLVQNPINALALVWLGLFVCLFIV